jgi:hypothetical protein
MHHMQHIDPNMKDCIELCNECRDECETMLYQHCLEQGGKHVEQEHVKLMTDCIEACQTAAHFMLRGSDNHALYCSANAEICESCADSCEEVGGKEMEDCAKTCRKCAESCRKMSAAMPGARSEKKSGRSAGMMA